VDARAENFDFINMLGTKGFLLASQCAPEVFQAAGNRAELWHANTEGVAELLADEKARPVHLVGGGSTVGLNAMVLAWMKGFRSIHLYGFDSSLAEGDHHAYPQALNDDDRVIDALFNGRRFRSTAWMIQQANEFQQLAAGMMNDGCTITVHGDG